MAFQTFLDHPHMSTKYLVIISPPKFPPPSTRTSLLPPQQYRDLPYHSLFVYHENDEKFSSSPPPLLLPTSSLSMSPFLGYLAVRTFSAQQIPEWDSSSVTDACNTRGDDQVRGRIGVSRSSLAGGSCSAWRSPPSGITGGEGIHVYPPQKRATCQVREG